MKANFFTKFMAVALIALLMCSTISFAGTEGTSSSGSNGRFSVGLEAAFPMGDFGNSAGTGFGGSLRYEMPVGDHLGIMATAGYLTYGSKTSGDPAIIEYKFTSSIIPIQVGGKWYFMGQQDGFYVSAEVGVHLLSTKTTITVANTELASATGSSTAISYAPGIGYHLANLDFGVKYQLFSESVDVYDPLTGAKAGTTTSTGSYLGIRVAYVFGSK